MALNILDLLKSHGLLVPATCELVKSYAHTWGVSFLSALLNTHIVDEHTLADQLALLCKHDRLYSLAHYEDIALQDYYLSYREAKNHACFISGHVPYTNRLEVVVVDPTDTSLQELLQIRLKDTEEPYQISVSHRSAVLKAIDEFYPLEMQMPSLFTRM